jgi:hypothetical protein
MSNSYNQKMVISGQYIEIYEYQKAVIQGFKLTAEEVQEKISKIGQSTWEKSQFTLTRTRRAIRRLINCNVELNRFLTLTFNREMTNVDLANYEFKKFIERLKYAFPDVEFKYLSVIEFQGDTDFFGKKKKNGGSVHYHVLISHYIPYEQIKKLWGNGIVNIKRIKKVDNIGAYVSKYLTKETAENLFNKKKYFTSRNLEKPFVTVDNLCIDNLVKMYRLKNIEPRYKSVIENDFTGRVVYNQFKLDFKKNVDSI